MQQDKRDVKQSLSDTKSKPKKDQRIRQCIVTRETLEISELIRFVLNPDDVVIPDLKRSLPGRGVWLKANAKIVELAVEKQLFSKAFKKKVQLSENIVNQIDDSLLNRALQRLALANKAGEVICGFSKLEAAIMKKDIIALIHASEARPDGRQKLEKKWLNITNKGTEQANIIVCFKTEQLSLVLGRPNVIHAGLQQGGASLKLLEDIAYLERFRSECT